MQQQSLIFLFLIELLVITLSVAFAKLLARPLRHIASHFREVAEGNLDNKIRERRFDEIGSLFKSFNSMLEKLKKAKAMERFTTMGEVSASIAHEFKNSIVALKSFVKLFPKKHNDKEFVEMYTALVPHEMHRWERMLKELSEFSNVDVMYKAEFLVSEVIEEVAAMLARDLEEKKISYAFLKQAELPVCADKERIKQVIMNIVLNAVQAMTSGGGLEIIEDVVKKQDLYGKSFLSVSIKDTGNGIAADFLPRIFDPFRSNKSGSLGLGLAISRRIIENHRGTISVSSIPNTGTSFTFLLPL
jgi:signal transduction histidine kinase